jgi:hypothetical protein
MAKILGSALYFLYVSPTGNWGHGTILIEQNASGPGFFRELIFSSF